MKTVRCYTRLRMTLLQLTTVKNHKKWEVSTGQKMQVIERPGCALKSAVPSAYTRNEDKNLKILLGAQKSFPMRLKAAPDCILKVDKDELEVP